MNRTFNLFLGLFGSLFGVSAAIYSLYLRDFKGQVQSMNLVETTILYSIVAVIGSFISFFKPKIGGWVLIFPAFALVFTLKYTGIMGAVAATTLFMSSLICFKEKPNKRRKKTISKPTKKKKSVKPTTSKKPKKKAV